jgi:hypothetical protein
VVALPPPEKLKTKSKGEKKRGKKKLIENVRNIPNKEQNLLTFC